PDYREVIILDAARFNEEFGTDPRDGTPLIKWNDQPPTVEPIDAKKWAEAAKPKPDPTRKAEPDGPCLMCSEGTYEIAPVENCSCHISPPCWACVSAPLVCDTCGHEVETD